MMYEHGILPGRFAPFHRGHEALIHKAQALCTRLTVLVCSHPQDTIPGWLRYSWLKNHFPELDVRHAIAEPGAIPDTGKWESRIESIGRCIPPNADALFSAGHEFDGLAAALGIPNVVLTKVEAFQTAAIHRNPWLHTAALPDQVRAFYVRRVALIGPESSGKSYLAEHLAMHFKTVFVEEYGRTYCEKFGMNLTDLDFAHIAGGQLLREDTMAQQANRVLFCDTELIVTQVWSEIFLKGACQPWIFWANHLRHYDLFLLLAPDIPWVNDGLREYENQRQHLFQRLREELESRNLPYTLISGDYDHRTRLAIEAVEQRILTQ